MNSLVRAGWALGAVFFATVLASIAQVDHVGLFPEVLLLAFALLAAARPAPALEIVAAIVPVAGFLFSQRWNPEVPWAQPMVMAALAGMSARAAVTSERGVPAAVRAPALLFCLIVAGSMIAGLGVPALRLGPDFRDALATQILQEYFVETRGFPALHAGMLLLQGVLLLALGTRFATDRAHALARIAAMSAAGAALAAGINIAQLLTAAARAEAFWPAMATLAQTVRWNIHYGDFNAAGSYFAMTAVTALGLAAIGRGRTRAAWTACAVVIACALWLTASRAAYLAFIVALGGAAGIVLLGRARQRALAAGGLAVATVAIVLAIAVAAPTRGNQHSSIVAADTRVGMARVAVAMLATRPTFGIGLGEFYQRSGEFATPELLATFPAAVHENAHNNFLQIAAELGLVGGIVFAWLIGAGLLRAARGATADPLRLMLVAGLGAFVITWLAGHPLLVPETSYAFWILLGVAVGTARKSDSVVTRSPVKWILAACAVAIVVTIPWRMRAQMDDADLEHVGVGLSGFHMSPDGIRYRLGEGHATLFVPPGPFKFSVNLRSDTPMRLEVKLDGRIADVVTLAPHVWNDLAIPARSGRSAHRYAAMQLTLLGGDQTGMWVTKIEPIR